MCQMTQVNGRIKYQTEETETESRYEFKQINHIRYDLDLIFPPSIFHRLQHGFILTWERLTTGHSGRREDGDTGQGCPRIHDEYVAWDIHGVNLVSSNGGGTWGRGQWCRTSAEERFSAPPHCWASLSASDLPWSRIWKALVRLCSLWSCRSPAPRPWPTNTKRTYWARRTSFEWSWTKLNNRTDVLVVPRAKDAKKMTRLESLDLYRAVTWQIKEHKKGLPRLSFFSLKWIWFARSTYDLIYNHVLSSLLHIRLDSLSCSIFPSERIYHIPKRQQPLCVIITDTGKGNTQVFSGIVD